jgi:hypothetical protein
MTILVKDRSCGDCAACCHILAINSDNFIKAADTRCANHKPGIGCTIYANRPSACQTWYCAWRLIAALPDEYRPDRLGAMLSFEQDPAHKNKHIIVARAFETSSHEAYTTDKFHQAVSILSKHNLPVWISLGSTMTPFEPNKSLTSLINLKLHKPSQNRNDLCNCGSLMRYKHCHGKFK